MNLFGESFKAYIAAMSALHYKAHGRAEVLLDTLAELRDTNSALLTTRQNEIMKNLTVVASIILPLSLVVSLFGMNTVVPFSESPLGFWIVVGIIFVLGCIGFLYFKLKRWF